MNRAGRSTSFSLLLAWLAWAAAARGASPQVPPPPSDPVGLRARFAAHVNQDRFRHAHWGVRIVSIDTGQPVFEHNADDLLIPASNTKLFTGALALDRLGPEFRIRTSVCSQERPT
ncbi:MAG TPA: D-alanyl-D-alanine carboxypeptidase, partial [Verrucomicrobiota bacterium]|nr:D-alanyl-D-alanine carboxypeptidase [Verrucomicrobiota bacterium]